jgi:hypothetical protein
MAERGAPSSRIFIRATGMSLVVVFMFVWLFGAALHAPTAHDLPIGIVAPKTVVGVITQALEKNAPGAFVVATYETEDAARDAIADQQIGGALVMQAEDSLVLVAGAAGTATSSAITAALSSAAHAMGQTAVVEDIQPLPASDSKGMVPFFLVLGLSVSSMLYGLFARTDPTGLLSRITKLIIFAILAGLVASLAVSIVTGFSSTFFALAGVCVLLALAVASFTSASCSLFGSAGIAVAGLVVVMLGNASSGSVIGANFLSQPFRFLSGGLPAGAGLTASRSVLYFDQPHLGRPIATLAIWIAGSLLVIGASALVAKRSSAATVCTAQSQESV